MYKNKKGKYIIMTFDHIYVNEILETIFPIPKHFGLLMYKNKSYKPINFKSIKKSILHYDPTASIYYGMSKLVITSPKINNIVIKIPFNGVFEDDEDTKSFFWCPFEWADGSDSADYCLTEYEKYKKLEIYGLDCFVAKTIFYKKMYNTRIFIQEKVIPIDELIKSPRASHNSKELADEWYEKGKINIDPEWIANCLDAYGKSKVSRFLKYCNEIDLDILEDIHTGNFGYRKDKTPCILDYSNYNN